MNRYFELSKQMEDTLPKLQTTDIDRIEVLQKAEAGISDPIEEGEPRQWPEELLERQEVETNIRSLIYKLRKEMNDISMRMFLRTTVCFKNISLSSSSEQLHGPEFTGNHIAIFECELKAPPQLSFIDHSYSEYLEAYRMNFKNWKIVDIDNFMEGNHYFSEIKEEDVWRNEVRKLRPDEVGYWKEEHQNSPNFLQDHLKPELYQRWELI